MLPFGYPKKAPSLCIELGRGGGVSRVGLDASGGKKCHLFRPGNETVRIRSNKYAVNLRDFVSSPLLVAIMEHQGGDMYEKC